MRKLDNERVKHNLVCKFFGCTNCILEDSLTLSIFYNGLDSDNKAFVFERVVPDICKTRGKHPTQVSWMDITLVLDSYSLDHLVRAVVSRDFVSPISPIFSTRKKNRPCGLLYTNDRYCIIDPFH